MYRRNYFNKNSKVSFKTNNCNLVLMISGDYNFLDYTMAIRATSSQLPRPRMFLQVQQVPCGSNSPPVRPPPPSCDETFYGPGFEMRSPYYPHGLSSSVDCRYIIQKSSPFMCHLELTFDRFELPDSRHCYASHLRIDADRLCGSISPYSVSKLPFLLFPYRIFFKVSFLSLFLYLIFE